MYDDKALSGHQATTAWKLARSHGHLWAYLPEAEAANILTRDGWTEALWGALNAAERLGSGLIGGIVAPSQHDGVIRHTTGSGRLTWTVDRDGVVTLLVDRPSGPVLLVRIGAEIDVRDLGRYGGRHVEALRPALYALLPHPMVDGVTRRAMYLADETMVAAEKADEAKRKAAQDADAAAHRAAWAAQGVDVDTPPETWAEQAAAFAAKRPPSDDAEPVAEAQEVVRRGKKQCCPEGEW